MKTRFAPSRSVSAATASAVGEPHSTRSNGTYLYDPGFIALDSRLKYDEAI
jgi:hypothetical protein